MPLIEIHDDLLEINEEYWTKVFNLNLQESLAYGMDLPQLHFYNKVFSFRTAVVPKAARIDIKNAKFDYTVVYVLVSFPNGVPHYHEENGDFILMPCPSGDVNSLDGKEEDLIRYTHEEKSREALINDLYPHFFTDDQIRTLPERVIAEFEEFKQKTQEKEVSKFSKQEKQESIRNIIEAAKNSVTASSSETTFITRSELSLMFYEYFGLPLTFQQLDAIFGELFITQFLPQD